MLQSQIRDVFETIKSRSIDLRSETLAIRKNKLKRLEKWILKNRARIQMAVGADLQKPKEETDISEIFVVLSEIRQARIHLKSWNKSKKVPPSLAYLGTKAKVKYEPKGACLVISPWNFPFLLAVSPLVSAMAAGNTVILKPSEYSPHTSGLLMEMCNEVFDGNEVRVILGGVPEAQELLSLPFDHIFFTGSTKVGKIVMAAAARNLSSVTLELGGKSPTIIDKSANIKDAAQKIAWSKWQNAGQVCVAPDYLLVQESVKEILVEELMIQSERIYGNKYNYTGIISRDHHNRINDLMADAIEKGAEIEFGGKSDRKNLRFSPTLLSGVSLDMSLMKEEIFGPILPLLTFNEEDEPIKFINAYEKPLALYIFSKNESFIKKVVQQTSSGTLAINDAVIQFAHPRLPFGGVNHSGIGKAHGFSGFKAFSNEKSILQQRIGHTVSKTIYPPYTKLKKFIINFMLKYLR